MSAQNKTHSAFQKDRLREWLRKDNRKVCSLPASALRERFGLSYSCIRSVADEFGVVFEPELSRKQLQSCAANTGGWRELPFRY
jgi:ribosomal protein S14